MIKYLQESIKVYNHRHGKNRIRFLAWKDGVHFFYYLWVHRNVGVDNHSVACLSKNKWREPCPICDDIDKKLKAGVDWEVLKKEGTLLGKYPRILIQVVDRMDEQAGVQVWDVSAFEIDAAITVLSVDEDTGAIIPWTDPANGCDLIYDYDPEAQMPQNLHRSKPNPISVEFYRHIKDFDTDVICK